MMNIKCGFCGKAIVVADDLVDGQHVRCPYCGEKSEYRKPTRIELSKYIMGQPRNQEPEPKSNIGTAYGDNEVPEIFAYKRNPNLYIRHPGNDGANVENGRRNALVDQVTARANAEARRKLMAKLKRFVANIFALIILALLVVVGFKFYKTWKCGSNGSSITDIVECIRNAYTPTKTTMDGGVDKSIYEKLMPKKQPQEVIKGER